MRNIIAAALTLGFAGHAAAADRSIGYVVTDKVWAVYQTADGKAECPNGLNNGPREEYKILWPDDGKKRKMLDTHLAQEADIWFPEEKSTLPYSYIVSKVGIGLNLDGKVGAEDFTSPAGEAGIDNQLYRAVGCTPGYRGPDGPIRFFENDYMQRYEFNRILIEISELDDLTNDNDVTVTTYRGLDELLTAATGKDFIPGGTQRIDDRWGKRYVQRFKGKIVDGVLTTEAADWKLPWAVTFEVNPDQIIKAARFRLKLTPTSAEGLIGGYVDARHFHQRFARAWSTHHASYGQVAAGSLYRAIKHVADGYPDPVTGENTAVSAAAEVKFVQAYIMHPKATPQRRNVASAK